MPIPAEHRHRFAYHFTNIENLPGILKDGFLCPNEQLRRGLTHKSIALKGIQHRRSTMKVTCGPGGVVHDYVPFYLCKRSSMLLSVVNAKNIDQQLLIYLAVPISVVERQDVVITNASANTDIPPDFFSGAENLRQLNWGAIDSQKWSMPSDAENQARMAEVLVPVSVDLQLIDHIIVWNESFRKIVLKMYQDAKVAPPPVRFDPYHYLTKYPENRQQSLVTGPIFTKRECDETIEFVREKGQSATPRFLNISSLLTGLRRDFGCVSETAELVGLESDNEVHKEDAGKHTLSVVRELLASAEFRALNAGDQRLTELAAYFHDIGKGPKSRWASNGGKQRIDPDHPIGSVKMLRRILTEEIGTSKSRSVRVLSRLVCYHELVGDILVKGRDPAQLEEIAHTERELDMLIALGLADAQAINPIWAKRLRPKIPGLRARVLAKLNTAADEEEENP